MSLLINAKNLTTMSAPISDKLNGPLQILSYNAANMSREILTRFNAHVIENTSTGVVSQMKLIVKNGYFCSADETTHYSANIGKIRANLLCLAGKLDNMAPPSSVLSIYHRSQSPDKMYRLFGLANGYSADYGHNDLLLGKKAPDEVYPYILAWLNQH
jgi:esterase/lipase